jgi:hypothetical protein
LNVNFWRVARMQVTFAGRRSRCESDCCEEMMEQIKYWFQIRRTIFRNGQLIVDIKQTSVGKWRESNCDAKIEHFGGHSKILLTKIGGRLSIGGCSNRSDRSVYWFFETFMQLSIVHSSLMCFVDPRVRGERYNSVEAVMQYFGRCHRSIWLKFTCWFMIVGMKNSFNKNEPFLWISSRKTNGFFEYIQ